MNQPTEARVLLVDDDRELCQMLGEYLSAEHFEVKSVHDGGDALVELQQNEFEILILDVMLPSVGGFDVLRKLGATYTTPILMLTARGDDVDRIVGLELGADDYITKPFSPRELAARVRSVLRRAPTIQGRQEQLCIGLKRTGCLQNTCPLPCLNLQARDPDHPEAFAGASGPPRQKRDRARA